MLGWALCFFMIAIISGMLGLGGIASATANIAEIIAVIFMALFAGTVLAQAITDRNQPKF